MQEDFEDFSDAEHEAIPASSVVCSCMCRPDGVWVLFYLDFQITLPGSGPWWVEQTSDGHWMATDGARKKLCSNLTSLERAVLPRAQRTTSKRPNILFQ